MRGRAGAMAELVRTGGVGSGSGPNFQEGGDHCCSLEKFGLEAPLRAVRALRVRASCPRLSSGQQAQLHAKLRESLPRSIQSWSKKGSDGQNPQRVPTCMHIRATNSVISEVAGGKRGQALSDVKDSAELGFESLVQCSSEIMHTSLFTMFEVGRPTIQRTLTPYVS